MKRWWPFGRDDVVLTEMAHTVENHRGMLTQRANSLLERLGSPALVTAEMDPRVVLLLMIGAIAERFEAIEKRQAQNPTLVSTDG